MGEGLFSLSSLTASREARLATVGTPISPLDEFRVLDPASEREVAGSEVGELAELSAHLAGLGVAKFKWPERLEWVQALPRTPVGKLDKKLLQREIAAKLAEERRRAD